jgi:hypothetical protein
MTLAIYGVELHAGADTQTDGQNNAETTDYYVTKTHD